MNALALTARIVLAALFAVAGLTKLADRAGTRKSLAEFGLPAILVSPVTILLPLAELACAVALVPVSTAWWGAAGSLALLSLFTIAMAVSLARGQKPDCHCFGQLRSEPIGPATIVRNVLLAALAVLVVARGAGSVGGAGLTDTLASLSEPRFIFSLLILLAALALFELWMLVHVLRQNGRLLLRLDAIEAKVGAGAASTEPGLPVGVEAPAFSLVDLVGQEVTLGVLGGRGPLLLFFTEPGCGACERAAPEVARWQRAYSDRLSVVLISRGDIAVNQAKSDAHRLRNVLLQKDREVSEAYRVAATPSAVLVKDGLIASPLTAGIDAIRTLVTKETMPPPLKKKDAVPPFALPDLDQRVVDLSGPRKHPTLVLFWSPSCGYCQAMLQDLRAWERERLSSSPELLMVSNGTVEANRQQRLRSPILIDSEFLAGRLFSATGTPSAVLIDQEGRVASDLVVGAQAVMTLAGEVPAASLASR
jgi:peroxiredoxin/uncharacterized membrane protein YphA (DoxX/SURF4 family)